MAFMGNRLSFTFQIFDVRIGRSVRKIAHNTATFQKRTRANITVTLNIYFV